MILRNKKRGFALLFAVLTASILLTIGLSIFNISLKELLISTSARDSQVAFYAADSARECALYWDLKGSAFKTCLSEGCDSETEGASSISCGGADIGLSINEDGDIKTSVGEFIYHELPDDDLGTTPDSSFFVRKDFQTDEIITAISTAGHNAEAGERRLERGILQRY